MADFRSAPGRSPAWHRTSGAFSNFEFIDTRFGSHPILRRIFSSARKLRFGGLLVEQIAETDLDLLASENAAFARRCPDFRGAEVTRFSFFSGRDEHQPGALLGCAVFKLDHFADRSAGHVFEAVMAPARDRTQNNFTHCTRTYEVRNSLGTFSVKGVLYAQQNNATSVCAHVALRTLLSCMLPGGDITYEEINRHAGVDHADPQRRVGDGKGLSVPQVEAVLHACGFAPRIDVHEPGQLELPAGLEFQRLLYDFIESGRPALLGFELAPDKATGEISRHVIPVFGHTFNEDLWVPEAERSYFAHDRGYFPSESWLSNYLAHDDNFGPYVCLPRHYLGREQFRLLIGCHEPAVILPAAEAETLAIDVAMFIAQQVPGTGVPWFERFRAFARSNLLVLRAQIVSAAAYTAHLRGLRDREGFDLESAHAAALVADFPVRAWLIEISAPELFPGTRAKFGEIIVDATQAAATVTALHSVRLPGRVFRFQSGRLDFFPTQLRGHTPLFALSQEPSVV